MTRLNSGSRIGPYEVLAALASGGMGEVYRVRDSRLGREVALKILPPELAAHSQVKSRFVEEAKGLAQLDSPHIVHLYNFGEENGCFVLAMQFIRGKTWERMILENQRLEWAVGSRIAVDVLRALEYAHGRGVVHRDMKPSNVLVRQDDGIATVMDFGIAKMTTSTRLTATGQTMGTVRYMSPEQVRGQEVDLRTDLYSLGATFYESITGDTPFDGNTHFEIMTKHLSDAPKPPSALGIELPPELERALMKSLAKKPADRFQSAREFRKAIETVLRDTDVGLAETMRLARESIVAVRPKRPSLPPPPGASQPAAAVEMPTPTAPGRTRAASESLTDPRDVASLGLDVLPRSRAPLWIVLALLLLAGGGIAVYVFAIGPDEAAPAAPRRPPAFQPPGVTWIAQRETPALGIYTAGPITLEGLVRAYERALADLDQFLASSGKPGARPDLLNIVAVPKAVLCDPATSTENGRANPLRQQCDSWVRYYRPLDRTLVVASEPELVDKALRLGLADYLILHRRDLEAEAQAYRDQNNK